MRNRIRIWQGGSSEATVLGVLVVLLAGCGGACGAREPSSHQATPDPAEQNAPVGGEPTDVEAEPADEPGSEQRAEPGADPADPRAGEPGGEEEAGGATPMDGDVEWRLVASATRLSMAQRGSWRLRLVATNRGAETVRPADGASAFEVNGAPSMAAGLAFGNGAMEPGWMSLAPGRSVSTERELGEALFEAPGTYEIVVRHGEATSAPLTVVVTP